MTVIGAGLVLPLILVILNGLRARRQTTLDLVPNCLMTRFPIVFIRGRPSPFYFLRYWNTVPQFLSNHGYEVRIVDLKCLPTLRAPVHLVIDSVSEPDPTWLSQNKSSIESLTVVGGNFSPSPPTPEPRLWLLLMALHRVWTGGKLNVRPTWLGIANSRETLDIHKAFLSRAIFLAENDLKCSH